MITSSMDLHALIKHYGLTTVAEAMGCAAGSLRNKRSGHVAITLDELHRLICAFPRFDCAETIRRIGNKRRHTIPINRNIKALRAKGQA